MNAPIRTEAPPGRAKETGFDQRVALVMQAVSLYHAGLRDYVYRLTKQWQDAEDIVQDLWKYVVVHFPEDRIQSFPLLRRKAFQIFVDRYRSSRRNAEIVTDEVPDRAEVQHAETDFNQASEKALKNRFWQEFPGIELTELQKEVLWLYARYGMTYQEIEQQLGVPSSTVGDWITAARKKLAAFLNQ